MPTLFPALASTHKKFVISSTSMLSLLSSSKSSKQNMSWSFTSPVQWSARMSKTSTTFTRPLCSGAENTSNSFSGTDKNWPCRMTE